MNIMRKYFLIVCCLILFLYCGEKGGLVERTYENGVEIVLNHLEPSKTSGMRSLVLEELFRIDSENSEIAKLGLSDIRGLEVSSGGELFVLRTVKGDGNHIFKFDRNGRFVKSFGPKGQGPGEIEIPFHIALDREDDIYITDSGRSMALKFDQNGVFTGHYRHAEGDIRVTSGPGQKMAVLENSFDDKNNRQLFFLKLANHDLEGRTPIDQYSFEMRRDKFRATEPLFCWSASRDHLFVANEEWGYEIRVYEDAGKLIRKIRKDYRKMPFSEGEKKKILGQFPEAMRALTYFPEFHPPFQSLVAGDDGMLFVPTFEQGSGPGEFLVDIFNKDGLFIARGNLNTYVWEGHFWARLKSDRFYCLREKDSGFKEIIVYKVRWDEG